MSAFVGSGAAICQRGLAIMQCATAFVSPGPSVSQSDLAISVGLNPLAGCCLTIMRRSTTVGGCLSPSQIGANQCVGSDPFIDRHRGPVAFLVPVVAFLVPVVGCLVPVGGGDISTVGGVVALVGSVISTVTGGVSPLTDLISMNSRSITTPTSLVTPFPRLVSPRARLVSQLGGLVARVPDLVRAISRVVSSPTNTFRLAHASPKKRGPRGDPVGGCGVCVVPAHCLS